MKILFSYRQLSPRAHGAAETFFSHRVHREHRGGETLLATIPNANCTRRTSGQATLSQKDNKYISESSVPSVAKILVAQSRRDAETFASHRVHREHRAGETFASHRVHREHRAGETLLTTKTQRHKDNKNSGYKIYIFNSFVPSRLSGRNNSEASVLSVAKPLVAQRPLKTFVSLCLCGEFNSIVAPSRLRGQPSSSVNSASLRATSPQRPLNISEASVNSVANNSLFAIIPPQLGGKSIGGVV